MYSLSKFYVYAINYPYVVHFDYRHFGQLHLNKLKVVHSLYLLRCINIRQEITLKKNK